MKKYLKSKKLAVLILLAVLLFSVGLKLIFFNTSYSADSDTGFYQSEYMTYDNGILKVKSPNAKSVDVFDLKNNVSKNTVYPKTSLDNNNYYIYNNRIVYKSSWILYVSDIDGNNKKILSEIFSKLEFYEQYAIYYEVDGNLVFYNIETDTKTTVYCGFEDKKLCMFCDNDKIYLIEEWLIEYVIKIFDIPTQEKLGDFTIRKKDTEESFGYIPYGDKLILNDTESGYYFYDFDGNFEEFKEITGVPFIIEPDFINGDYLYVAGTYKLEHVLFDVVVDYEHNGVYQYNYMNHDYRKLSDKCNFHDIIATDNYVYCYRINYFFPGNFLKLNFVTGYDLVQIPI